MEKSRIGGVIKFSDLPFHFGLIVHLSLYEVESPKSPAPYGGDPPAEAATDLHKLYEGVDLDVEIQCRSFDLPFDLRHKPGYYFLEVRSILFQKESGKVFAQAEQAFFGAGPVRIGGNPQEPVELPVAWPATPLKDLPRYGSRHPDAEA